MIGPFGKSPKVSHNARAVVTGAGSGIGAAFATELAKRGGRVVCSDIDEVAAKRTVSAITDQGGQAVAIGCDVTQLSDVHELAAQSQSWFGAAPTLVINNAGVGSGGAPIGELPIEDWQWVLSNVASAAAFGAAPSMAAYNVSKAGALSLSETLAAELSGSGVKVTALCPTFVKTNILESGRISSETNQFAHKIMRWTGVSAEKVARTCLDAHDRGDLYCMPQLEAKIGWSIKRLVPGTYTRAIGLVSRVSPM